MTRMSLIETPFGGQIFRSRLDARWAVFFSKLGLSYKYESGENQCSPDHGYTPDFWLADLGIFVAINGWEAPISKLRLPELLDFSEQRNSDTLLIFGMPGEATMFMLNSESRDALTQLRRNWREEITQADHKLSEIPDNVLGVFYTREQQAAIEVFEVLATKKVTFGVLPVRGKLPSKYTLVYCEQPECLADAAFEARTFDF